MRTECVYCWVYKIQDQEKNKLWIRRACVFVWLSREEKTQEKTSVKLCVKAPRRYVRIQYDNNNIQVVMSALTPNRSRTHKSNRMVNVNGKQ